MKIKSMYKIIGELESLGDSGEAISRIILRRNAHQKNFDDTTIANLLNMVSAVDEAYGIMINNLMLANDGSLGDISKAYKAEENINELRNMLRDSEIDDIEDNKKNYQTSVYYIDLINELEKMGDFMINVSQELERSFIK
jgi:phosphate:Na+ symporter